MVCSARSAGPTDRDRRARFAPATFVFRALASIFACEVIELGLRRFPCERCSKLMIGAAIGESQRSRRGAEKANWSAAIDK